MRRGISTILRDSPDMRVEVVGDGATAIERYRTVKPHLAILDLRLPILDGIEVLRRIREMDEAALAVVLTTLDGGEDVRRALSAGAKGYLLKDAAPGELMACVRAVLGGSVYVSAAVAGRLAEGLSREQPTARELEILQLLARGLPNKRIADALGIADGTVKAHITNLLEKLRASSRTEAVAVAYRLGLIRIR
jgi:DNA-binding NarL/FixJ family response regulator